MSSTDIAHMCKELQYLVGGHLKKAYLPHYEQIVLRMNPKGAPQKDIVIIRGERLYLSNRDRPMPMTPPPFAMVLRKHLKNARLLAIEQIGADRILKFTFDSKFGPRALYIEMFQNGNILLVDEHEIIIQALTSTTYAGRTLKKGHVYECPLPPVDPRQLDEKRFRELTQSSDQPIGRTLGGKLNLGSTLSDAICLETNISPTSSVNDIDSKLVFQGLKRILNDFDAATGAHIILEEGINTEQKDLIYAHQQEKAVNIIDICPIVLNQFHNHPVISFPTFSEAIDAWIGLHDSSAHQRREDERFAHAHSGRGPSTQVERLERRLAQQQRSMKEFNKTIEKHQLIGQSLQEQYDHVHEILQQVSKAVEQHGWMYIKDQVNSIRWIDAVDSAEHTVSIFLKDESGEPFGKPVRIHINLSVHQNAQKYFEKARKHKNKSSGAEIALQTTEVELKRARKKESKLQSSGKIHAIKRSKKFWFERYKWAVVEGGHLLIGGKDAKGNDSVVKKHCSGLDMYLHADLHGAPSCSLRSNHGLTIDPSPSMHIPANVPSYRIADKLETEMIDEQKLKQSASMALAWSKAWASGGAHGTVYSVKPTQVSKTAETGEYIGSGGFIVRGQRTWFKDIDLTIGIGMIAVNGTPLLMTTTTDLIGTFCQRYAILAPGREKKEKIANQIYKSTGLPTDDILAVIPGACEIVKDHGLFTPVNLEEE